MKMFNLLVSFMTISVSVEGSIMDVMAKCDPEKPTGCEVRPIDNADYAIQQLEKSLVIATPNVTVYSGQTAVFRFEVDRSVPPMDFSPVAYINGCQDNKRCTLESPSVLVCTIDNVTLADDGLEVYFYSVSHELLARLCYNPPSYLTVLGPPLDIVNVSSEVDPCDGINLTLSTPLPPDTNITYSLYDSYTNRLLIHSSFPPNSATTNIPANLLTNHSGVYWIIVTATNPAGNGPPTNITIDLSRGNNSLISYSNISGTSLEAGPEGDTFNAIVTLQVNPLCPLTVPNRFFITSSCANNEWAEYPINMTHLLEDSTNQITLHLPLIPGQRNCSVSIKSEGAGDVQQFIDTGQSTFLVQSYSLQVNGQWANVNCSFITGLSTAVVAGCYIRLVGPVPNSTVERLYQTNSSGSIALGPLLSVVEYTVYVYDYINDNYNKLDPVYTTTLSVPSPSTTTSSSAVLTTTSRVTTPMTSSTVKATDSGPLNPGSISGIAAVIIGCLLVAIVVAVIVLVVVWNHTKRGKRSELVPHDDDGFNRQNGDGDIAGVANNDGGVAGMAIINNPPDDNDKLPHGPYHTTPHHENHVKDVKNDQHSHGDDHKLQPEGVTKPNVKTRPANLRLLNLESSKMVMVPNSNEKDHQSVETSFDDYLPENYDKVMFSLSSPLPSPSTPVAEEFPFNRQCSIETVTAIPTVPSVLTQESSHDVSNSFVHMPIPPVGSNHMIRQDRTPSNMTLKDTMNPDNRNYSNDTLKEVDNEGSVVMAMVTTTTPCPSQNSLSKHEEYHMPHAVKESVSGQDESHTGPVFKTDLSANPGTTNTTTNDSETTELLKRHTDN